MKRKGGNPLAIAGLCVAILLVLGFVGKTAWSAFSSKSPAEPTALPPPRIATAAPGGPSPAVGMPPAVRGAEAPTRAPSGANPFRKTVASTVGSSGVARPVVNPVRQPRVSDSRPPVGPMLPPGQSLPPVTFEPPPELQRELQGVIAGSRPIAVVRTGEDYRMLRVGDAIDPRTRIVRIDGQGVWLRMGKRTSRWKVGSTLLSVQTGRR